MEPISVNRLIGAPPGYVGYEEGGQLTEAVRMPSFSSTKLRRPTTTSSRRSFRCTVDFKNTVIIMTSNIGSRYLLEGVQGDSIPDSVRESVMADLRKSFRPEFLNRIDETILFKPLTREEIASIVDLLMVDLNKRLADRQITVKLAAKAKEWVAEKGYDPVFGARPLKRYLQRNLQTKLARALIAGEVSGRNHHYFQRAERRTDACSGSDHHKKIGVVSPEGIVQRRCRFFSQGFCRACTSSYEPRKWSVETESTWVPCLAVIWCFAPSTQRTGLSPTAPVTLGENLQQEAADPAASRKNRKAPGLLLVSALMVAGGERGVRGSLTGIDGDSPGRPMAAFACFE